MFCLIKKHVIPIKFMANFKCYTTKCPMIHRVFVYGTLKRNEPNNYWLTTKENGDAKFVSEGVTKYKYPLVIATRYNIPFLLSCPGEGHNVKGEIYMVDDTMMSNLDVLEDHPNYYQREITDVMVENDETQIPSPLKCWVYFLKSFKRELLKRPMLEEYSSAGDHGLPYLDRSSRDPHYDHRGAVKVTDS